MRHRELIENVILEKVGMAQCYRCEKTHHGQLKVAIIFSLFQALCLTFYSSNSCVRQKRSSVFNQSDSVNNDTKDSRKRCFKLSWKSRSLTELVESNAGKSEELIGKVETRNETNRTRVGRTKMCNRFVTLGKTKGRMGNQMFEVASLIGIAYKYDALPVIQENLPLNKYFNLPNRVPARELRDVVNVTVCDCKKAAVYYHCSQYFDSGANVSVHGYLQSWKYFEHARNIIRDLFSFESVHVEKARQFIEGISKNGYQRVCTHIRRGDMATREMERRGYAIANMSFIEKAMNFYKNKFVNVKFIVVSDDKKWCRKNLKDITISPFTDPGDEMALMMLCDHVIVTAGTFGWWGAWLSPGTIVYFNGHPRPESRLDLETNRNDYYPSNWIAMT